MNSSYKRLIRVAITFAVVCFLVYWGLSVLSWRLFPEQHSTDELMQQWHWAIHVVAEKVGGLVLMSLAAFLAARSHRPTWKSGVSTAIATGVIFQLVAIMVYLLRFGGTSYRTYNDFIHTMMSTVALAWLFGFFAVWRQYRHERHAS
jgi:hypothetical protein